MQAAFQKVTPGVDASFACFERVDPAFEFAWHYHPECELTLITRSRGRRFVGDHIEAYGPGDLVLMGPDLPHTWCSDEEEAGEHRAVVIQFARELWGTRLERSPEMHAVVEMLRRADRGLSFREHPQRAAAADLVRGMPQQSPADRLLSLLRVLNMLTEEGGATPLASVGYRFSARPEDRHRIDRVCRFLQERYTEPIVQTDVARHARMNPAAFSRFFKKATGRTMTAYVNELRIARACRLLVESDLSVLEICYRCGFGNLSNFNRQFRRVKHMSPGAYRRRFWQAEA